MIFSLVWYNNIEFEKYPSAVCSQTFAYRANTTHSYGFVIFKVSIETGFDLKVLQFHHKKELNYICKIDIVEDDYGLECLFLLLFSHSIIHFISFCVNIEVYFDWHFVILMNFD